MSSSSASRGGPQNAAYGSAKAQARPDGQEYYDGHQHGEHLDVIGDADCGQTDSKSGSDDLENRVHRSRGEKPTKELTEVLANDLVKI